MDLVEIARQQLYTFFDQNDLVEVLDERGDGHHFLVKIESMKFEGMSRIERSRKIHELLGDLIKNDHMHAVRMELSCPAAK